MNAATVIIIICAAALIVFAIWRTIQKFRGKAKSSCCGSAEAVSVKAVADTDESHYNYCYKLDVSGMKCSNCARNVENAINGMDGAWAKVNLGRNQARVLSKEERSAEDFSRALEGSGYKLSACQQVEK